MIGISNMTADISPTTGTMTSIRKVPNRKPNPKTTAKYAKPALNAEDHCAGAWSTNSRMTACKPFR